jgi:hypothetical protein
VSAETDSYSETARRLGLDPRTARDRVDPAWLAPLEHAVHADHVAYEPGPGRQRLRLPLVNVLGRPVLPPREITWMFDVEFGTLAAQLDPVMCENSAQGYAASR